MRKVAFISSVQLCVAVSSVAIAAAACFAAPPSNDLCANARVATLGSNPFTNIDANALAPGMTCATINNDVWFKFTSTFTGNMHVSTCSETNFNSAIAVYAGCGCESFTELACNDQNAFCPNNGALLTVAVQAGQCYLIRVAGVNGASGIGLLSLTVADQQNAAIANRIKTGFEPADRFGHAVAGDGRINGDSLKDILIGAYNNDTLGSNTGRSYAYKGADLSALYTITGAKPGENFGYSVALVDVNNDGRADLIIGAPRGKKNGVRPGRVYAYSGFDGSLLWKKVGQAAGDRFGHSVAGIGDYNNDGYDDVIVGAPYYDNASRNVGRVYIFSGQNGAKLKMITGRAADDLFGWSVAGIGDLNNDGKPDFAVGAPKNDTNGTDAGQVSLYKGGTGGLLRRFDGDTAGDQFGYSVAGMRFNSGSNFCMLVVGAPFNDAAGANAGRAKVFLRNITSPNSNGCTALMCVQYTINGGNAGDRFGTAVAVGNLVNSAVPEIIVGAHTAKLNGNNSGALYAFEGATGSLALRYYGEAPGDNFGRSVAFAGDVNNDGNNDLIVGAPLNDAGGSNAGRAYVFFINASAGSLTDGGEADEIAIPIDKPGDATRDGIINHDDLTLVLNSYGPCANDETFCAADLDYNRVVDVNDLLLVISNWMR